MGGRYSGRRQDWYKNKDDEVMMPSLTGTLSQSMFAMRTGDRSETEVTPPQTAFIKKKPPKQLPVASKHA